VKTAFICPYCLEKQPAWRLSYRCQALPQVCAPVADETYNKAFHKEATYKQGKITRIPTHWRRFINALYGKFMPLPCGSCATPTTSLVCSHCHGPLKSHFLDGTVLPTLIVAENRTQFDSYVQTLRTYLKVIGGHDINATLEEADERHVFSLTFAHKKWTKPFVFSFFYVPYHELSAVAAAPWFKQVKGAIVMLDMNAFTHAPSEGDAREKIWQQFEVCGQRDLLKKIPVAFTFTPKDLLTGLLPAASVLHHPSLHIGGYNQKNARYKHNELIAYMGGWCGANTIRFMRNTFKRSHLFAVSLKNSTLQQRLGETSIEEPFFWLLKKWRLLNVVDGVAKEKTV